MKIERKEKIKKFFGWGSIGILYAVSFALGCAWTMLYGDTSKFFIFMALFHSPPFFSFALVTSGIIGTVIMIALKANENKIIFSILTIVAGVVAFLIWFYWYLWWVPLFLLYTLLSSLFGLFG